MTMSHPHYRGQIAVLIWAAILVVLLGAGGYVTWQAYGHVAQVDGELSSAGWSVQNSYHTLHADQINEQQAEQQLAQDVQSNSIWVPDLVQNGVVNVGDPLPSDEQYGNNSQYTDEVKNIDGFKSVVSNDQTSYLAAEVVQTAIRHARDRDQNQLLWTAVISGGVTAVFAIIWGVFLTVYGWPRFRRHPAAI